MLLFIIATQPIQFKYQRLLSINLFNFFLNIVFFTFSRFFNSKDIFKTYVSDVSIRII